MPDVIGLQEYSKDIIESGLPKALSAHYNRVKLYSSIRKAERALLFAILIIGGTYDSAIDHIFVDSSHSEGVSKFDIITSDDACNTSDHRPLYIDYVLTHS